MAEAEKERPDYVFIPFNKKFVAERVNKETGEPFIAVTVPAGTIVDGVDVGGRFFTPLYANDSKYRDNEKVIPILKDKDVWLREEIKQEDGSYLKGETLKVTPESLKNGVLESRKEYFASLKKEKQAEKSEEKASEKPKKAEKGAPAPARAK